MSLQLAAIITAAGASSRMGTPKALLPWRDTTLITHQVEQLHAAGFGCIVVVVGCDGDTVRAAVPASARVVHNRHWSRGRSSSIEVAAASLPDALDAILVVGVDQPLVAQTLTKLLHHAGAPLVEPVDERGRFGHPVILGGEHLTTLRSLHTQPLGLRSLVRTLRPQGVQARIAGVRHRDLNTPEDYRRAVDEDTPTRANLCAWGHAL